MKNILIIILSLTLIQCSTNKQIISKTIENTKFKLDTLILFDQKRNREIPIAIYQPNDINKSNKTPIIFSHGYGENNGKDYLERLRLKKCTYKRNIDCKACACSFLKSAIV